MGYIYETKLYKDERRREVAEIIVHDGERPAEMARFYGIMRLTVVHPKTRRPVGEQTAEFPIHGALTLRAAFDAYDALSEAKARELSAPQIEIAGAGSLPVRQG